MFNWDKKIEKKSAHNMRIEIVQELKEWYAHRIPYNAAEKLFIKLWNNLLKDKLDVIVHTTTSDYIKSEKFLDEIVERIMRKQVK